MRQWKPVTQAYSTPLFFFCRGAARRGGRTALLFLLIRADRERVGGEGHDRGCLPGHRGHEVRLAFLRQVRKIRKNKQHAPHEGCHSGRIFVNSSFF